VIDVSSKLISSLRLKFLDVSLRKAAGKERNSHPTSPNDGGTLLEPFDETLFSRNWSQRIDSVLWPVQQSRPHVDHRFPGIVG
jgi:hypothetical protein